MTDCTAPENNVAHNDRKVAAALAEAARTIDAPRALEETLDVIVHAVRVSVSGFDEVGISLVRRDGRIETRAATGQLVRDLDALQYELREGPCIDAIQDEPVIVVENVGHQGRWPSYVPAAARAGLRSQMGLRLYNEEDTLGALNLYSTHSDTVDAEEVHTAELFATHAALALGRARRESQLAEALESRTIIGTAVGLVMERYRIDRERALQFLVRASSTSNVKLRDIATDVVASAEDQFVADGRS